MYEANTWPRTVVYEANMSMLGNAIGLVDLLCLQISSHVVMVSDNHRSTLTDSITNIVTPRHAH